MDNLAESLASTSLNDLPDLEQLPFKPQADSGFPRTALYNIPRYLFRVASPLSAGETNEEWVFSEAAYCGDDSSKEDIFDDLDNDKRTTIARTLNLHFRWWPKRELEDNFVSWTSSLLDAIQFIYYRHLSPRDKSELDDINLFIIDTTLFPKGTFLRDLDLIDTFCEYDTHEPTKNLEDVRYMRDDNYFGEYLSQGELKIEGKCETISAKSLFQCDRLRRVQPHFLEFHELPTRNGKPVWAIEVIRLREAIWTYADAPVSSEDMMDRLDAVKEIIQDLKPGWGFPLAVYFTALIGAESTMEDKGTGIDNVFLRHFNPVFSDGMSYVQ
ncbi:hypothetical protein N7490_000816 [Penicillium lividum]|nr:hypothetical protein N7490_000816 [Penicillium lividum]